MQRSVKLCCFLSLLLSKGLESSDTSTAEPNSKTGRTKIESTQTLKTLDVTSFIPNSAGSSCSNEPQSSYKTKPTEGNVCFPRKFPYSWIANHLIFWSIIAGLFVLCLSLLITCLILAYKMHKLKSSRHYQIPTGVSRFTTEECAPGDREPSETCVLMNKSNKPEEKVNSAPEEVCIQSVPDPIIEEEVCIQSVPDPIIEEEVCIQSLPDLPEEESPGTLTTPYQDSPPE